MKKLLLSIVIFLSLQFNYSQLVMNNTGVTTLVCGGTFLDPGGAANYANSTDYTMTLCSAIGGQCIYLQFLAFNIESGFDYMYVYDGPSTASPQVPGSPFTGTVSPGSLSSTTGCLTIRFISDGIVNAPGWTANVICQPCGSPPPPPPGPVTASDCSQAVNVCTNLGFSIDPNGFGAVNEIPAAGTAISNPSTNPASGNMGCLLSGENNSTWMIVNISGTGNLEFSFGAGGAQAGYYDWAMWPYTASTCASIPAGGIAPVRCNWNAVSTGGTGLASVIPAGGNAGNYEPPLAVTCGQQYLICFSNYSSVSTTVPLQFGGTATVSCSTFLPITVNNAIICPGATATLTASGGTSYSWNTGPTTASINVSPAATTTYTVTGTGPCGSGTATATVTVLPPGDPSCACSVTASNTGPYCVGSTVSLSSTAVVGATSYNWSGPNSFSAATQNASIAGATALAAGVYTVTVTTPTSNCTATTTVVMNPLPASTASNTGPYCAGATIQLNSSGGGTYAWTGPGAFANATQNPTRPASTVAMSGVYTVTVTSAAGCTSTSTTTVTVNPLPTPTSSNTGPYCIGATIQLNSTGGGTYSWAGPSAYANGTQNPTLGPATAVMAGTYTVTVTSAAGCTSTSTTVVGINPLPTPTASNTGPYCAGATIQLNSTGGGTYAWSGPGAYANATQNPTRPASTVAMSGVYTVTVTSAAGCTSTSTTTVTVNPLPTPTSSNTGPYCAGATIQLNSTGGGTYAWSGPLAFGNGTQNPTLGPATAGMSGFYTVTVTNASGCTATSTNTVVVNPIPTPTASNTGPYCAGATIQLNSTGGGTYAWSGPLVYANGTQNPTIGLSTTGMSGVYTVTVTSAAGCTSTSTTTVTVNPIPTPTSSNTGPYCAGATIQLNSTGGGTYAWSGPLVYANGTQNPTLGPSTVGMSGVYTVTVTSAAGCTSSSTNTVVVNPLPTPTSSNTGPYCEGNIIQLNSTGGGTYAWSGPLVYANGTQNPTLGPSTIGMGGIYTVTVTTAAGCTSTSTNTVVVNPLPTPTASNTGPYCSGSAIQLNATGGGTYAWTGPLVYSNATQNPSIAASTPAMSGVYTVTVTSAAGCTSTSTTSVVVNAAAVVTASNTGPYCAGATAQLNATAGGISYSWSGPGAFSSVSQNPSIAASTPALNGVYTVTITLAGGCTGTSTTTLTVNPLPLPTSSNTGPYCAGTTIQLNSTGGTGYSWSGPLVYSNGTQNPTIGSSTVGMTGTYTVTVTDAAGCTSTSSTVVTVNPLPTPTSSNTGPYCAGTTILLNSTGGGTYAWSGPLVYANGTQNPTIALSTAAMSGVYTVTVTSGAGCTSSSTTAVTVNPLPLPTSSNTGPYCAGATIQLNSTGGTGYSWSGPLVYSNGTQNPTIGSSTTGMSGTYTVTVTDAAGCTSTSSTVVTVNALPAPTASNTGPYCTGSTIQLNSTGGTGYSWSGPLVYSNGTQNPTIGSSTVAMSGDYTVTVTNAAGCTSTMSTTVVVNATPTPTASNTGPYCAGSSILLGSTGGGTYSWSGPLAYSNATQNPSLAGSVVAMSGIYTVTVTLGGGCTGSATTAVTVNPLPTPTSSNTGPYCAGTTIQLNSTGGTGYSWSGPLVYSNGTQNPTIGSSTVGMTGTYTVTVTDAAGCTSTSSTVVTVNPLPTPTSSNTGPYCAGATIQLNSTGGGTYAWSGPLVYANGTQNPTIALSTAAMSGVYTVTVTSGAGCTSSSTTAVTVNPLPLPTSSNTGPYCAGATIQLNSTGGTGYSWSGPLVYSNGTQNPTIGSSTTGMSGTYTVTVTDAAGCTSTSSTVVTVNALPAPTASNTGPYCTGSTIQLNSTGGTGYSWSGPLVYSNGTQNPTIGSSTVAMSGTYTVVVTNALGCTSSTSTVVTVNPLPLPTSSNTGPYCAGANIQLNATGGTGYSWSGPLAYANGTQNPSIASAIIGMSGTYTVTVTDAAGCTSTSSTIVIVNSLPTPLATNTGPYCDGSTMDLTSSGGVDYDWAGPAGFSLLNTQNGSVLNANPGMSGVYTVTVTDANGCVATANTSVTINGLPNAVANNNTPICEFQTINFTSNGGVTYDWTGPGAYSQANTQNPSILNAPISASGIYTVTVTDANGCISTATTTAIVNSNLVFTASSNSPICSGTQLDLTAQNIGGANYNWTGPNGFIALNQQNPTIPGATVLATGTYTVLATNGNGCTGTATVNVLVNPLPTALFAGDILSGCAPLCVNFSDQSVGNGATINSWSWNVEGQSPSNNQNETFCFANPGLYDASLTVTTTDGCSSTLSLANYITVNSNPIASFDYTPQEIDESDPQVIFASTSIGASSWLWNFGDGGNSLVENPIHNYGDTGVYCILLTVSNAAGCMDTATGCLYIEPVFSLYIPNAFTVNEDGLNETFNVYGRGIKSIVVRIFDRWGEELYMFDDLNKGWPGTRQNGQICKQDVYVYRIEVVDGKNDFHEYMGRVTLIR